MYSTELTFFGGLLLGLTSTLHCSAMCGGISCSAVLSLGGSTHAERLSHTLFLQLGRICSYCILGGLGAAFGSTFLSPQKTMTYQSFQWIAAIVLMWSGLAIAGMLPRLLLLDTVMVRLSCFLEQVTSSLRSTRIAPFSLGLIWGFNPCPMVYAALFTATLTASPMTGILVMAGFGIGTMPGVVLTGLGLTALKQISLRRSVQVLVGLFVTLFGFASFYIPARTFLAYCLNP